MNGNYPHNLIVKFLLHSCVAKTMRASVVILFALLALAFVVANAADEVSVCDKIAGFIAFCFEVAHNRI